MDRSLLRGVAALAGATLACASANLAGCSSDSSNSPAIGSDAEADQTTSDDGSTEPEAAPAEAGPDVGPDIGPETGGDAGDASVESGAHDAGPGCMPVDASLDEASVLAGQDIVGNYSCFSCHGYDLSGGSMISGALAKNITPDPATGIGCWTDQQLVTAILYGTTPTGITLCVMPKWGTTGLYGMTLDAGQAEQVVQYLRSIQAVSNVVAPSSCETPTPDGGADAAEGGGSTDAATDAAGNDAATDAGTAGDSAAEGGDSGTD
jgi:hypothetical protein